jgi:uridine kinase
MGSRASLLRTIAGVISCYDLGYPVKVAIDGIDCAGKTRFADELKPFLEDHGYPVIRSSIDGFHNPEKIRYSRGRYDPEGYYLDSFNYRVLLDELLLPLGPDGDLIYRKKFFDYKKNRKVDLIPEKASEDSVLVFDGVFLLRPEIFNQWELKIFLDISFDESKRRGIIRDEGDKEEIIKLYEQRYIPAQKLYFLHAGPKRQADIVIDNNDPSDPRLTYVSPKIGK